MITGMEEIESLESVIRAALPNVTGRLAHDARAIMGGKFPAYGTRLDALRDIVGRIHAAGK